MQSKIVIFLIGAASFLINVGCGDKYHNKLGGDHIIPYTYVYTEIPFGGGGDDKESWREQARYFAISAPNPLPLGYAGHGIVVFTSNLEEFQCFDATCTNCANLESYFTQKDLKGNTAICPVCGTEFELYSGQAFGNTEKIYPLKSYGIYKRNNTLIVSSE